VEIRTLLYGLAAFLILVVALTLIGIGGAAGNATGLLFWVLLVVLGLAYALSRVYSGDEGVVRVTRRARNRDRR
jgi:hypothetical protein